MKCSFLPKYKKKKVNGKSKCGEGWGKKKKNRSQWQRQVSKSYMRFPTEWVFLHLFPAVGCSIQHVPLQWNKETASCFSLNDNETGHQKIPHSNTGDLSFNSQFSSAIKHLCSHLRSALRASSPLLSVKRCYAIPGCFWSQTAWLVLMLLCKEKEMDYKCDLERPLPQWAKKKKKEEASFHYCKDCLCSSKLKCNKN